MSYLDRPRLVFSGQFFANPSTINNDPNNFDPMVVLQSTNRDAVGYTSWGPDGSALFRLVGCNVTSAVGASGPAGDPIVGASVATVDAPLPKVAKIVDLDPDQQGITQLYGVKISIALAGNAGGVSGMLQVAELRDLWLHRAIGGNGDKFASGIWQSVLTDLAWTGQRGSPVLDQLYRASPDQLSIKFTCDQYHDQSGRPDFATGRIAGLIGPAAAGEPRQFVMGRRLVPGPKAATYPAAFAVSADGGRVSIDMGNSLQLQSPSGPPAVGTPLQAQVAGPGGVVPLGAPFSATLDDYPTTAWVFDVPLTPDQASLLAKAPLEIVSEGAVLLQEPGDGRYVNVEPLSLRLNPGETGQVTIWGATFGRPMAGASLPFGFDDPGLDGTNDPQNALVFDGTVVLNAGGQAVVPVTVYQPRPMPAHRQFIGSQVYWLGGPWEAWGQIGMNTPMTAAVSVLVFDTGPFVPGPTWLENIGPILQQYAKLYPAMKPHLDLEHYASVKAGREKLQRVLTLPFDDPGYMPVTRDLSAYHRDMILAWVRAGCPE